MGTAQQVVYRGPAPSIKFNPGARVIVFERDVPQPVEDDDFVTRLLALAFVNEMVRHDDGTEGVVQRKHTLEEAARYGTHVFELVSAPPKPATRATAREGVDA